MKFVYRVCYKTSETFNYKYTTVSEGFNFGLTNYYLPRQTHLKIKKYLLANHKFGFKNMIDDDKWFTVFQIVEFEICSGIAALL